MSLPVKLREKDKRNLFDRRKQDFDIDVSDYSAAVTLSRSAQRRCALCCVFWSHSILVFLRNHLTLERVVLWVSLLSSLFSSNDPAKQHSEICFWNDYSEEQWFIFHQHCLIFHFDLEQFVLFSFLFFSNFFQWRTGTFVSVRDAAAPQWASGRQTGVRKNSLASLLLTAEVSRRRSTSVVYSDISGILDALK